MNVTEGVSLQSYNTFGINEYCKHLIKIQSVDQLIKELEEYDPPFFILGGGSNLLLSSYVDQVVLKNEIEGIEILSESPSEVTLRVGGGMNWHTFVLWALEHDYGGIENLSLIPGTVGASPIQNIGAYGVELDQVFVALDAVELSTKRRCKFTNAECQFGYRDSVFKNKFKGKYFISHVTFRLTKQEHDINVSYAPLASRFDKEPSIQEVSEAVIQIRRSKLPDPAVIGNSGSFFKNPIIAIDQFHNLKIKFQDIPSYYVNDEKVKVPAGWLIEKAGWKGKRIGMVGTYEKQALVLVNHGKASGNAVIEFARLIIEDVHQKFGIILTPEVNII